MNKFVIAALFASVSAVHLQQKPSKDSEEWVPKKKPAAEAQLSWYAQEDDEAPKKKKPAEEDDESAEKKKKKKPEAEAQLQYREYRPSEDQQDWHPKHAWAQKSAKELEQESIDEKNRYKKKMESAAAQLDKLSAKELEQQSIDEKNRYKKKMESAEAQLYRKDKKGPKPEEDDQALAQVLCTRFAQEEDEADDSSRKSKRKSKKSSKSKSDDGSEEDSSDKKKRKRKNKKECDEDDEECLAKQAEWEAYKAECEASGDCEKPEKKEKPAEEESAALAQRLQEADISDADSSGSDSESDSELDSDEEDMLWEC